MANLLDTFTTLSHQDFQWPYPKPLLSKPSQPPMNTRTRNYEKRDAPLSRYRSSIIAVESPTVTRRYTSSERPNVQPTKSINFLAIPESFNMSPNSFTGRSEYMDTFCKIGLSNMKNQQQYLEPLPSSRRRFGDWKI